MASWDGMGWRDGLWMMMTDEIVNGMDFFNEWVFLVVTCYLLLITYLLLTINYHTFKSTPYLTYLYSISPSQTSKEGRKPFHTPPETALRGRPVRGT